MNSSQSIDLSQVSIQHEQGNLPDISVKSAISQIKRSQIQLSANPDDSTRMLDQASLMQKVELNFEPIVQESNQNDAKEQANQPQISKRIQFLKKLSVQRMQLIQKACFIVSFNVSILTYLVIDLAIRHDSDEALILVQQLLCCLIFNLTMIFEQKLRSKCSFLYIYLVLYLVVLLQHPFQGKFQAIHTVETIVFVMQFTPMWEVTFGSLMGLLLNNIVHMLCDKVQMPWSEVLLLAIVQFLLYVCITITSLKMDVAALELATVKEDHSSSIQYEDTDNGIFDCNTFEMQSDTKRLLDGMDGSAALIVPDFLSLLSYQDSHSNSKSSSPPPSSKKHSTPNAPSIVINQEFQRVLAGIALGQSEAIMFPIFEEYKFDHPISQLESQSSIEDVQLLSLYQIIKRLADPQQSGKVYVKQLIMQSQELPESPKRSPLEEMCISPSKEEKKVQDWHSMMKRQEENEETNKHNIFEFFLRPVYFKKKLQYLVQMKKISGLIDRACKIKGLGHQSSSQILEDSQKNVKYILNHSRILEQQIAAILGCQSRITISDEILEIKNEGEVTPKVLAQFQFFLANIWSIAAQLKYSLKTQQTVQSTHINKFQLNFVTVMKSLSVENYVKQFLILFSPQIQLKNLHLKVSQGSMPDQELFLDWSVYKIILFQLLKNAIQYNIKDGSISVQIMFRKEFCNFSSQEGLMRSPADHNEVGKLITVIKNTGAGISKERMKESLDENEGKSSGLLTAKRLSSYLGGSLQINSLHDVGTQVTFEVQCTYYPVRNFKIDVLKETNTKKEKSVLFLPLQKRIMSQKHMQSNVSARSLLQPQLPTSQEENLVQLKLSDDQIQSSDSEYQILVMEKKLSLQIEDSYHPKSPQDSFEFDDVDQPNVIQSGYAPQDQLNSSRSSFDNAIPIVALRLNNRMDQLSLRSYDLCEQEQGFDVQSKKQYKRNSVADCFRISLPSKQIRSKPSDANKSMVDQSVMFREQSIRISDEFSEQSPALKMQISCSVASMQSEEQNDKSQAKGGDSDQYYQKKRRLFQLHGDQRSASQSNIIINLGELPCLEDEPHSIIGAEQEEEKKQAPVKLNAQQSSPQSESNLSALDFGLVEECESVESPCKKIELDFDFYKKMQAHSNFENLANPLIKNANPLSNDKGAALFNFKNQIQRQSAASAQIDYGLVSDSLGQDRSNNMSNSNENQLLFSVASSLQADCKCNKVLLINSSISENKVIQLGCEIYPDLVAEIIIEKSYWQDVIHNKLQNVKICCNSIYSLIFMDLGSDGIDTATQIRDFVLDWNEKQSIKGLSVVQLPLIIGINNPKSTVVDTNEILLHQLERPLTIEQVRKVVKVCARIVQL